MTKASTFLIDVNGVTIGCDTPQEVMALVAAIKADAGAPAPGTAQPHAELRHPERKLEMHTPEIGGDLTALALCETEHVALRPYRNYIFFVMPGCVRCADLAALYPEIRVPTGNDINRAVRPVAEVSELQRLARRLSEPWPARDRTKTVRSARAAARMFRVHRNFVRDVRLHAIQHGLRTGIGPLRVWSPEGDLPMGLVAGVHYWPIVIDTDNFLLAATYENSMQGFAVEITTPGTGYHLIGAVP